MVGLNRPNDREFFDPRTGKISLEWQAYFARLESLVALATAADVASFEGRTGAVSAQAGDYNSDEVTNSSGVTGSSTSDALDTLDADIAAVDAAKQPLDADLTALAALSATGHVVRTAAATYALRTITGTSNEISVSNGDGVSGDPTLSLPATIDLGGKTSLEIPNSAAPTVDADGEIAVDTSVTDFSHGILKYYSGEELGVLAMPIAQFTSPSDGDIPTYNAAADEFQLQPAGASSGGATVIASGSLPAAAALDITGIPSTYAYLTLLINGMSHNSGSNQRPVVQASIDNGSSFDTTSYRLSSINLFNSTTFIAPPITTSMGTDRTARGAAQAWSFNLNIFNYHGGSFPLFLMGLDVSGTELLSQIGHFFNVSAINALRITFTGGNIDAGSYVLYGMS